MYTPRKLRNSFEYKFNAPQNMSADSESSRLTVETMDNHIYFYADVDSDRCLAMMRAIRETDTKLRAQHISRGLDEKTMIPIWLHINSYGGDLFDGFSVADQLAMIKSPVYAIVEGICASAATLIAMSCTKRYILPNSFMLIHQLSNMIWGTHEQFKDEMNLQEKAMGRLIKFYTAHSSIDEAEVRDMLTRDFWLDAEASVEKGFADEILR